MVKLERMLFEEGGSSMVIGSVLGSVVALLLVISVIAFWKYRQAQVAREILVKF